MGLSQLIMAVRSQSKGQTAASELQKEFPRAQIEVSILDMVDYDSVTAFAKRCKNLSSIEIAILNAGIQNKTVRGEPQDGTRGNIPDKLSLDCAVGGVGGADYEGEETVG